jgi:hypothetical protein
MGMAACVLEHHRAGEGGWVVKTLLSAMPSKSDRNVDVDTSDKSKGPMKDRNVNIMQAEDPDAGGARRS